MRRVTKSAGGATKLVVRHSSEALFNGEAGQSKNWIPAFAGMTACWEAPASAAALSRSRLFPREARGARRKAAVIDPFASSRLRVQFLPQKNGRRSARFHCK